MAWHCLKAHVIDGMRRRARSGRSPPVCRLDPPLIVFPPTCPSQLQYADQTQLSPTLLYSSCVRRSLARSSPIFATPSINNCPQYRSEALTRSRILANINSTVTMINPETRPKCMREVQCLGSKEVTVTHLFTVTVKFSTPCTRLRAALISKRRCQSTGLGAPMTQLCPSKIWCSWVHPL